MNKPKNIKILLIILGSMLLAFTIYNIHSTYKLAEGGGIGVELLLNYHFNISPSKTALVMDVLLYSLGFFALGKKFIKYAIVGTLSYSVFYYVFEQFPPITQNIPGNPLLIAIIGGILVGISCGIVVKFGGATSGDDALAMVLSKWTKLPVGICYFTVDAIILLLSLTYIKVDEIIYSILTAFISSMVINYITSCNALKVRDREVKNEI